MIRAFATSKNNDLEATKADALTVNTQLAAQDVLLALKANISDPTFLGIPAADTAATGTNTTQLATTAFVQQEATSSTTSLTRTAMLMQFAAAHG